MYGFIKVNQFYLNPKSISCISVYKTNNPDDPKECKFTLFMNDSSSMSTVHTFTGTKEELNTMIQKAIAEQNQ